MNRRALDAQLLIVFDALMTERHVTRAGRALGLSQSAISHALARLRERFKDPLLVRTARGMEPTRRALALIGPVRESIRHLQSVFDSDPAFDACQAKDTFVLRIGDATEFLLLPPLLERLQREAPGVGIVVRHLSPVDTVQALEDGSVDLAVSAFIAHPKSIRAACLMQDRMVCALGRRHPYADRALSIRQFLQLRHVRVVQHPGDLRFLDAALKERGLQRTVVATIPHWLIALHAVACSDALAVTTPARLARHFDSAQLLSLRPLPIAGEVFDWQMYWHTRHDNAPAQRWIRALISEVCAMHARADAPPV